MEAHRVTIIITDDLNVVGKFKQALAVIAVTEESDEAIFEAYHLGADFAVPRPIDATNPMGVLRES